MEGSEEKEKFIEKSHEVMDVGYNEDFGAVSGHSDGSCEEGSDGETIEVKTKEQTFYYANQEGMAQCEYCGRYGVRDAFYSKTKTFCSMTCNKNYVIAVKEDQPIPKQTGIVPLQIKTFIKKDRSPSKKQYYFNLTKPLNGQVTFCWDDYLDGNNLVAPVNLFKHCPMHLNWEHIAEGMKVEVLNKECKLKIPVYWVATVIRLAGYKACLRYEGFASDSSRDFWLNLCSKDVYPIGWCAANAKPLVPPKCIENKYSDWKEYLVKRLTDSRTLPEDFSHEVQEELRSIPIRKGMKLEMVDKMHLASLRVATVQEIIGGRLMLTYDNSNYDNNTFWCHHKSPLLHPVGWAQKVGHKITASKEYVFRVQCNKYEALDCQPHMLAEPRPMLSAGTFSVGMKLESIDPLNLSTICASTVKKVLRDNYVMVGIDGILEEKDWFCYHSTSPNIFPVGFCKINSLQLTPPKDYKSPGGEFQWYEYLKHCKSQQAPVNLFDKDIPKHGFRKGMKLEAVDLMDPRLICVGTVSKVVGRLLCIHFDGWESSYDQWLDCESPDIYPVGWAEMVGYYLEGPRKTAQETSVEGKLLKNKMPSKRRRAKSQVYRGPRKKRKAKSLAVKLEHQSNMELSMEEQSQDGSTHIVEETTGGVGGVTVVSPAASSTQSALSSSVPAIATMLNSPPRQQQQQQQIITTSPGQAPPPSHLPAQHSHTSTSSSTLQHLISTSSSSAATGPPPPPSSSQPTSSSQASLQVPLSEGGSNIALWSVFDVCHFLRINDWLQYCDTFRKRNIDGPRLMNLSKEEIANLTGMKVGPSFKIYERIQAVKKQSASQQASAAAAQLTANQILTQLQTPANQTINTQLGKRTN